jgi:hypothetical protein
MIYRGPCFLFYPLSRHSVSKLDRRRIGRLRKRDKLLPGEGVKGADEEPNHTTARKPGPLQIIQYSLIQHPSQ